jgi:predicted SnoaL-like aldol condensation-catalyzing enzyme
MKKVSWLILCSALLVCGLAQAQEAVMAAPDTDALFHSPDPKLNKNKQAAYMIIKELIEAGHWENADKYLTPRYLQHNPNAKSGRDGVVAFFTQILKQQPKPIPAKMQSKVVAVTAEGDYVTVSFVREYPDPKDASKKYTTTWFDMWRFVDGKADEHWDCDTKR